MKLLEKDVAEEQWVKERKWNYKPFLLHPNIKNINLKGSFAAHLHSIRLHPSPLPKSIPPSSLYIARACRHFIAAPGDMRGDGDVDNVFWGEGIVGEMKQR